MRTFYSFSTIEPNAIMRMIDNPHNVMDSYAHKPIEEIIKYLRWQTYSKHQVELSIAVAERLLAEIERLQANQK